MNEIPQDRLKPIADIVNLLRDHTHCYRGNVRDEFIRKCAEILGRQYNPRIVSQVLKTYEHNPPQNFPSIGELKNLCLNYKTPETINPTSDPAIEAERAKYEAARAEFEKLVGKDSLKQYARAYRKYVYGEDFDAELSKWHLGDHVGLWDYCAILDLADARGNTKQAIAIGQRKFKQAQERMSEQAS